VSNAQNFTSSSLTLRQGKFEHFFLMNIFTQSIKQGCEYFVQINMLAYFTMKKNNNCKTMRPAVSVLKLFFVVTNTLAKKLARLSADNI
jgi:hypothetical protein